LREGAARVASILLLAAAMLLSVPMPTASAQSGIGYGDAFVTKFSGTRTDRGTTVIDSGGVVGRLLKLRALGGPPRGNVLRTREGEIAVKAGQVGQVFGVAIDDADPPNIYVAATSAFGLHRSADGSGWMDGMWGPNGGGPATIWKINGQNDYRPELYADITLGGRHNTGASLGGLTYDRLHRQLFVADLETGMIHRLSIPDGTDLGHFDHGVEGRASFLDATSGASVTLPPVTFRPESEALVAQCPFGDFAATPFCWNFADFRRRVHALAVRVDPASGKARLYYSLWSSQGFGNPAWNGAGDERRNSIWSIGLGANGDFDRTDVRREFLLPDMFFDPSTAIANGPSQPVTDIAFPACGTPNVMVLAERGGRRNLGLGKSDAFAMPHESRVLRARLDSAGRWQIEGHLDVGYGRRKQPPLDRANAAGGVAFGYGYDTAGGIDTAAPDGTLWATGDNLCTKAAPCFDTASADYTASGVVHGLQGMPAIAPAGVFPEAPAQAVVPNSSFIIDVGDGGADAAVGGVAIRRHCAAGAAGLGPQDAAAPVTPASPTYPEQPPGTPTPQPPTPGGASRFDLALTKSHTGVNCQIATPCEFTITITNVGNADFTGPLYVSEHLSSGGGSVVASAPWTCQPNSSGHVDLCYHLPLKLAPGASVDLALTTTLPVAFVGYPHIKNCAAVVWMMSVPPNNIAFEKALALAGYNVGAIDDIIDATAQAAILQYQNDHGLSPTGTINDELRASLFGGDNGSGDINPANDQACVGITLPTPATPGPVQPATPGPAQPATPAMPQPAVPLPATPPAGPATPQPLSLGTDLSIAKKHVGAGCIAGAACKFEVTVTNVGSTDYKGTIKFHDALPPGWTFLAHDGGLAVWKCNTLAGSGVACEFHPSVPIGTGTWFGTGASVAVTLTLKAPAAAAGQTQQNCASIIENPKVPQAQNAKGNDKACVSIALPAPKKSDLGISKDIAGMIQSCPPDSICKFELVVSNNGPDAVVAPILVADDMPKGWSFKGQSGVGWKSCTVTGQSVSCQSADPPQTTPASASLKSGGTLKLVLEFMTGSAKGTAEKVTNCAMVSAAGVSDPNTTNDKSCVTLDQPAGQPDLRVTKAGPPDCREGFKCNYLIYVVNDSEVPYEGPITIIDSLDVPSTSAWANTKGWTCKPAGTGKVKCDYPKVKLGHLKLTMPLQLTVVWPQSIPDGKKDVSNCAAIDWPAGKGDLDAANDKACVTTPIKRGGTVTGSVDWGWYEWWQAIAPWQILVEGTADCIHGETCSFYRFTARLQKSSQAQRYQGPLDLAISLPSGSQFPGVEVSGGGTGCGKAGWRCVKGGDGFNCTNAACRMDPGGEIAFHLEGHILPAGAVAGRSIKTRTACGVLGWQIPLVKDSIEQMQTDRKTARGCIETRILPPRRPPEAVPSPTPTMRPCPSGMERRGDKCVFPPCPSGMERRGDKCVFPPCPRGVERRGDKCVFPPCPSGMERRGDQCVFPPCPSGMERRGDKCVQLPCSGGRQRDNSGRCVCPHGLDWNGRLCVPPAKRPPGTKPKRPEPTPSKPASPAPGKVQPIPGTIICPKGQVLYNGRCINRID